MKVALIQLHVGRNKALNLIKVTTLLQRAISAKAKFILLPELFTFRGKIKNSKEMRAVAEQLPGESLEPMTALARKHRVWILAGSVYERVAGTNKVYNTSCLIAPTGRIVAKYRKRNLFQARLRGKAVYEPDRFLAGKEAALARVAEFTAGLSVCYDLRFPAHFAELAANGANLLCVPSNFTRMTGQAHWETLLRARAIENLSYVLAPNQIGDDDRGIQSYGHSMVVDPWGKILARASATREEIIYADISQKRLKQAQTILPGIRKSKGSGYAR